MKKIKILMPVLFVLFLIANGCKKLDSIGSLSGFNVTANQSSYNIGDTAVFTISSNADIILFYSGQPGFNVNNRSRNLGIGTNILKFQTGVSQSSITSKGVTYSQNNGDTIYLKVSTNLKSYDSFGVANATWTDISNLAQWPTPTTNGFVNSGSIDISQFNNSDSVYIAFQVIGHQSTLTAQRKWQIQGFTLSNMLSDSTFTPLFAPTFTTMPKVTTDTMSYFPYVGWVEVNMHLSLHQPNPFAANYTNYNAWNVGDWLTNSSNGFNVNNKPVNSNWVQITNSYPLTFDPGNVKNNPINEGWVITSPVNLKLVRHDFPTAELKDELRTPSRNFRYVGSNGAFATYSFLIDSTFVSGKTYDMGFVAQDRNVNQNSEVVKHVQVRIN